MIAAGVVEVAVEQSRGPPRVAALGERVKPTRSANRTETSRRSLAVPAGWPPNPGLPFRRVAVQCRPARGSPASATPPAAVVGALVPGAPLPASAAPQSPQKRAPGRLRAPQSEHVATSAEPHASQNRRPAAFALPQRSQVTGSVGHAGQGSRTAARRKPRHRGQPAPHTFARSRQSGSVSVQCGRCVPVRVRPSPRALLPHSSSRSR